LNKGRKGMDAKKLFLAVFTTIFRAALTIAVILVVYKAAVVSYDYGYRIFTEPAVALGEGRKVTVIVSENMSPLKIGELFEQEGLVRDAKLFALQYLLSEYRKDVKAGTFTLSTAMTAEDMMAVMAAKEEKVLDNTPSASLETSEGFEGADGDYPEEEHPEEEESAEQ